MLRLSYRQNTRLFLHRQRPRRSLHLGVPAALPFWLAGSGRAAGGPLALSGAWPLEGGKGTSGRAQFPVRSAFCATLLRGLPRKNPNRNAAAAPIPDRAAASARFRARRPDLTHDFFLELPRLPAGAEARSKVCAANGTLNRFLFFQSPQQATFQRPSFTIMSTSLPCTAKAACTSQPSSPGPSPEALKLLDFGLMRKSDPERHTSFLISAPGPSP